MGRLQQFVDLLVKRGAAQPATAPPLSTKSLTAWSARAYGARQALAGICPSLSWPATARHGRVDPLVKRGPALPRGQAQETL